MRTIIFGNVTADHLADAELFSGITPTAFITNGSSKPPAVNLPTEVIPQCPMVHGEPGEKQNHWRMAMYAEALILVGRNDHLLEVATRCELLIYEVGG